MALFFQHFVGMSFILLVTILMCTASLQSVTTKFTEGKKLSTSYTTLQKISKIQCVERCNKERQTGGCTLAGYNKATRSCYLSADDPQDVLDTTDEAYGVFFYEQDQTGNKRLGAVVKWPIVAYNYRVYGQQSLMKVDLQRITLLLINREAMFSSLP